MGLRELTTLKYVVHGDGQIRAEADPDRLTARSSAAGSAAAMADDPTASSPSPPSARRSRRSTTWPTRASPASSTWPTGWQADPRRGPGRHRQDPAGQVGGRDDRRPADPPPVLRGPRRVQGALRVELQEAAAAHPGRARRRQRRGRTVEDDIFSDEFLLTRPLLEAIRADEPVVLLIDEVDRVEVETEALLLEILSDYQVSIPELGTVEAKQIPLVFLTSNNTRELSEALKRRCLFLHIDYPDLEREKEIVLTKVPGHHRHPGRPGRPHRALDPPARAEEGAVGVRDARLGPHARAARHRARRRRDRPRPRSTSCSSTRPTSPRRSRSSTRSHEPGQEGRGAQVARDRPSSPSWRPARRSPSCSPGSSRSCARPACR